MSGGSNMSALSDVPSQPFECEDNFNKTTWKLQLSQRCRRPKNIVLVVVGVIVLVALILALAILAKPRHLKSGNEQYIKGQEDVDSNKYKTTNNSVYHPAFQAQLGMEDGRITDAQITASSCLDGNHCTDRARMNQPRSDAKAGAWSAGVNDQDQFIQVDLRQWYDISGVMTQGGEGQWVTSYKVLYSLDGLMWTTAQNAMLGDDEIFNGNMDQDTIVTNDFFTDITTRFIRFKPVEWSNHISMRFEVIGTVSSKHESRQVPLGMKDRRIVSRAITASSMYDRNHGPDRARLDTGRGGGKTGAWSALTNDASQWLQVDLTSFYIITGVITQGRQDYDQFVRFYTLAYSDDGLNWNFIEDCNGNPKVFKGNTDRNTKVTRMFTPPVTGRFIRIHPTAWNWYISMRLEILGKGPVAGHRFDPLKLGMEDGRILDSQLSSSTCYNTKTCTDRARLNQPEMGLNEGAWCAKDNNLSQWIQVDLLVDYEFHGIVIQGRHDADQWVSSYSLQYSPDGQAALIDVVDENGTTVIFPGNNDRNSQVINMLPLPFTARYVRINPKSWHNHISMRFELLGEGHINVVTTPGKLGIEDGRIATSSLSASSCWDSNHCVSRSRLNQREELPLRGAWCAKTNDIKQWIQVDLLAAFEVTGVVTQGRNGYIQWVTYYKISYSIDGKDWAFVKDCRAGPKIFIGNFDTDSPVENAINPPVTARFFRLLPVGWNVHISLRWELIGKGPVTSTDSFRKLGLEDYRIPESSLTASSPASSQYDTYHGPQRARLNLPQADPLNGAWSALRLDQNQWLQIDLQGTYRVTGIITQGHADADQWVTSYKVAHSWNGQDFTMIVSPLSQQKTVIEWDVSDGSGDGEGGEVENWVERKRPVIKVFSGNNDRSTQVTNHFAPPLTTRFVRVLPKTWHRHISMRMELLGTGPVANILSDPVPLGLESKVIPHSSLTASSEWDPRHGAKRARLNLAQGAWSSAANDVNQWIQVDLLHRYNIIAVATQGRPDADQWIKSYKLTCRSDYNSPFHTFPRGICSSPGDYTIFTGNADRNTAVINTLPAPHVCRYVRLLPISWHGHISLRMELYGEMYHI